MAAGKDRASGMKSAYELALERLEREGIEAPDSSSLSPGDRERIAEIRQQAEAKLAELEILRRDRLKGADPAARELEKGEYVRERRRVEDERDRKIRKIRS